METLLISAGAVAFAELGDKTQLLAIVLAARFRRPIPIILGILAATLVNHTLAALLGSFAGDFLSEDVLRGVLVVSFLAMAVWALLPDSLDTAPKMVNRFGAFGATLVSFFLIEMGDKTQLATMALAARFHSVVLVTAGTTLGMMIADVPAVYLGDTAAHRLPLRLMRIVAALIFIALALAVILDFGRRFLYA
jgi:putative Ca2+/H+ antiporter (TMEM165/GDT1 family)